MTEASRKKSFFARINDALYETVEVETGEADTAPGQQKEPDRAQAQDPGGAAPRPAAAGTDQATDLAADLPARLRQDIASRGEALSQFLALAGSFLDIIAEESGRYRAAMKALEKTGNITRQQVLLAANDQLRALESQREIFAGTVSRKREEIKAQADGAQALRAQIAELQQSIARLQAEEQELLRRVAADEGKLAAAATGFSALLAAMEGEIKEAQEKIEKYVPE